MKKFFKSKFPSFVFIIIATLITTATIVFAGELKIGDTGGTVKFLSKAIFGKDGVVDVDYNITTAGIGGIKAMTDKGAGVAAGYFSNTNASGYGLLVDQGNVGIGTLAPGHKLNISDTGNTAMIRIENKNSSPKYTGLRLDRNNNTEKWFIGMNDGNDSLRFRATNTADVLIIDSATGNVGIGTTAPSAKLVVAGDVKVTGGSISDGKTAKMQTFDTPGTYTWTKPANVSMVWVTMVGGGGGGGGCVPGSSGFGGAGGGGGGGVIRFPISISGSVSVTVGGGGGGGVNNTVGVNGNNTVFNAITVYGGGGGGKGNGGVGGVGGNSFYFRGEAGSSGSGWNSGAGGSSILGFGGPAAGAFSFSGGGVYGGGGSGGVDNSNSKCTGGSGGSGYVFVEWVE